MSQREQQRAQRVKEIRKAFEDVLRRYPNCPPEALRDFAEESGLLSGDPTKEDLNAAYNEVRRP